MKGSGTNDRSYLLSDERGSVIAVTNAAGSLIAANSYDEYGIPASNNMGRFQYTGQTWLPELGMYYYKARIYSPSMGRFLQADPIGYGDGMNIYAYVGNDPVNGRDPSGMCVLERGDLIVEWHRKVSSGCGLSESEADALAGIGASLARRSGGSFSTFNLRPSWVLYGDWNMGVDHCQWCDIGF